jgi:hypothetical protein
MTSFTASSQHPPAGAGRPWRRTSIASVPAKDDAVAPLVINRRHHVQRRRPILDQRWLSTRNLAAHASPR